MALKVGHAIASGIFDLKDTEEPFHPWWETAQDYICYSIILIGILNALQSETLKCFLIQGLYTIVPCYTLNFIIGLFALPTADKEVTCAPLYTNSTSPVRIEFVRMY